MEVMSKNKSKTDLMKEIRDEVANLTESPLYNYRVDNGYFPVLGEGSHDAKVVFIGEAPGANEARTGRPFCGAAGKILDELLESIGVPRKEVYITNILKDRPPDNRDPFPEEIALYSSFLDMQIEVIKPGAIATLGRFSMDYIMRKYGLDAQIEPISKAHGKEYEAQTLFGVMSIIPLYHPAVAIYNRNQLPELKKDFKVVQKYYV